MYQHSLIPRLWGPRPLTGVRATQLEKPGSQFWPHLLPALSNPGLRSQRGHPETPAQPAAGVCAQGAEAS